MPIWFDAAARTLLADRLQWPGRRAATKIRDSAARLARFGRTIAKDSLRADSERLAAMVFGEGECPSRIEEAEQIIVAYLHDRCLIEQVELLDSEGEPDIAAFRASLLRALAASAVGVLLDRAGAPLMPSEPYPGPVRLLEDLWLRLDAAANPRREPAVGAGG